MRTLVRQVVDHPVATTMVFLAALVFGWVSLQRLPIELMPDIGYPTITVRTTIEGAAPQEVESQVSRPIEEALSTLDGLVALESRSRPGSSEVLLGFDWGTDMSASSQAIREALQTTWLPDQADRPLILRYDPSLDPFLRIALSADPTVATLPAGDGALFLLRTLAEDVLQRELEAVPGVAAVRVQGGLEREIHVEVREDWLAARRVTLDQVRAALADENVNIAGGSILEGDVEYLVRTLNEFHGVDELGSLEVRRDDGVLVPLEDLAVLSETHRERQLVNRMNGGEAVELEVFKEADANVVDVARRVKEVLAGLAPAEEDEGADEGAPSVHRALPDGVTVDVLDDQASFIETAIGNVTESAVIGGLLSVVVLFLFLRDWWSTFIISLAIPVSILVGFAPLYLLGVSLNLMSLGGLALGVGMLVDNAVVVLESVQRHREEGMDRREAAVVGTAEVAAAVTASTLTTVGVFAPIAFVEGVAGELFGDLATAVCSSLMASLAVGLTLVPMLAALEGRQDRTIATDGLVGLLAWREGERGRDWLRRLRAETFGPPLATWRAARDWTRERRLRRWPVLVLAAGVLVGSVVGRALLAPLVVGLGAGARLLWVVRGWVLRPLATVTLGAAGGFQRRYDRFARLYDRTLNLALSRPGTVLGIAFLISAVAVGLGTRLGTELLPELHQGRFTVDASMPVGTPLAGTLRAVDDAERRILAIDGVRSVYSSVGYDPRVETRSDQGEHTAQLRVTLDDGLGARREDRVLGEVRTALAGIERMAVEVSRPALFSFRTPVEIILYTWDLDEQAEIGRRVAERLSAEPGLADVRSSLTQGHPEIRIVYDRVRLHRLGLDPATVAARVRDKVQGVEATRIQRGDQRIALLVQLVEPDRASVRDLQELNVNPQLQPPIPLAAVADFEEAVGPSEIRRIDQQRAVVVTANLAGFDLGTAAGGIAKALGTLELPPSVTTEVAGQSSEMKASLASLQFALGLAVFLVYVIMASTFESLIDPLVILFSVPLAIVGAVLALTLWGDAINVMVLIGAIVLVGIVVNNAIVLVDAVNRLREEEGLSVEDAIRRGGALRLRPILITAATTVLGLVPLALGWGAGAEMQGPLAVTVIGGMVSSTMLTLLVIPVVFRLVARRA